MLKRQEDPVIRSARREAWAGMIIWLCCLIYSVTFCYFSGYLRSGDPGAPGLKFILGFPDWAFWGIVVPWVLCCLLSFWLAFRFIQDADLGEEKDEEAGL